MDETKRFSLRFALPSPLPQSIPKSRIRRTLDDPTKTRDHGTRRHRRRRNSGHNPSERKTNAPARRWNATRALNRRSRPNQRPQARDRWPAGARARTDRLPRLEVAELLGDHLADVDAEPVDDPLRQVRVRRAAEHLYVGHPVRVDVRARRDQVRSH